MLDGKKLEELANRIPLDDQGVPVFHVDPDKAVAHRELRRLLYNTAMRHGAGPKVMLSVFIRMVAELCVSVGLRPDDVVKAIAVDAIACRGHLEAVKKDLAQIFTAGLKMKAT